MKRIRFIKQVDPNAFHNEAHSTDSSSEKFYFQVRLATMINSCVTNFFQFGDPDEAMYLASSSEDDQKAWMSKLEEGEIQIIIITKEANTCMLQLLKPTIMKC